MFRALLLRTIITLLCASPMLSLSWAQDKVQPPAPAPPYLSGAEITSQFSYSCPSETACSFICPGGVGGGADHVTKLTIYLGTMSLGNDQNAPALFYEFSTRERPNSSGFSISAGLSSLSCQVNGLKLVAWTISWGTRNAAICWPILGLVLGSEHAALDAAFPEGIGNHP
jgi:hypothetical protein